MSALSLECDVRTDPGRRHGNEDAAYASSRVAAVADGVGGAAAGEVASRTIVNAIINLDSRRLDRTLDRALRDSVAWGNETIGFIARCRPETTGMATTLTAVALSNEDDLLLANVGDSRAYLLRDGELRQLTRDDSLVQELIDRGGLDPGDAASHPQSSVVLEVLDGDPRRRPATARDRRPGGGPPAALLRRALRRPRCGADRRRARLRLAPRLRPAPGRGGIARGHPGQRHGARRRPRPAPAARPCLAQRFLICLMSTRYGIWPPSRRREPI